MSTRETSRIVAIARSGLLRPGSLGPVLRQVFALQHWGYGLAGALHSAAARSPGWTAIVDSQSAIDYEGLLSRSTRTALRIQELGVRAGDSALVRGRNGRRLIEGLLALSLLGVESTLLGPEISPAQSARLATRRPFDLLLYEADLGASARYGPAVTRAVSLTDLETEPITSVSPLRPPGRVAGTVTLTSGTTGEPKSARFSLSAPVRTIAGLLTRLPFRVGERLLVGAPVSGLWGHAGLHIGLALRATLVMLPRADPDEVVQTLSAHRCTALITTPHFVHRLLSSGSPAALSMLRIVAVGGAPLPPRAATQFLERYGDILYNVYGATEASLVTVATPDDSRRAPSAVGRPVSGTNVSVVDAYRKPLGPGRSGRVAVRRRAGPWPWSRRTVILDDLAHWDAEGRLHLDGRTDDLVISGGVNVFPGPTEEAIAQMPDVLEAAAVPTPDPVYGQRLAAYVVRRPGASITAEDVRAWVCREVSPHGMPRDVYFVSDLPRTDTGKVHRAMLRSIAEV